MGLDPFDVEEELELTRNYNYDLGYFEGIRGALIILQQRLSMKHLTEKQKVECMLSDLTFEITNAKELHNHSEKKFEEFHLE
jgi:hypothetical protein